MKEFIKKYKLWIIFSAIFATFILYTVLLKFVDVQAIGPAHHKTGQVSKVGFASLNDAFRSLIGTKGAVMASDGQYFLYHLTDWVSLITIPIGAIYTVIGIVQWCKRKNILRVDPNILALGCFYVFSFVSYVFFQYVVINYRPVLIKYDDYGLILESSYPSSTTVLANIIMVTSLDQISIYIKNEKLARVLDCTCVGMVIFFVFGRAFSGVHWITDVIGGAILSAALVSFYMALKKTFTKVFANK